MTDPSTFKQFLQLSCGVQNYPWGSQMHGGKPPFIAALIGETPRSEDTPYAELWVGAHPSLPSDVILGDDSVPLDQLIAEHPGDILGTKLLPTDDSPPTLPFLLKILSCEESLSIQAHPDRELAAKLHETDPAHYPDANHKPEIAIALTEFHALCRFRPRADIAADIDRLEPLRTFFQPVSVGLEAEAWLRQTYGHIFRAWDDDVTRVLDALQQELENASPLLPQDACFMQLAEAHPGDRGALSAYFLNRVALHPKQAMFMPANEPHAYLHGTIVECMANSDNVVRAGLTPKFVDTDVLLGMLTYEEEPPTISAGKTLAPGRKRYRVPTPEFAVDVWRCDDQDAVDAEANGAASLLLVLNGAVDLQAPGQPPVRAEKGTAWLWPAALEKARITSAAPGTELVRATSGLVAAEEDEQGAEEVAAPPVSTVVEQEDIIDFGELLDGGLDAIKTDFEVGDRVKGTVTSIGRNSVFVDIGGRSDGLVDTAELMAADGTCTVKVGDEIEAYCVGTSEDTIRLTTRMTGSVADASLEEAYQAGIPVEGRVESERKGGYEVQVSGRSAFCPYSQMDLFRREPETFLGERLTFVITEYGENGRNIVLSRRRLLEQEREEARARLRETLAEGDTVEGVTTKIMPFGVFVDLGGVEGLIHVSELGWGRTTKPEDVISVGQDVTVKILDLDWDNERISLSLKHAQGDPWDDLANDDAFAEGRRVEGTVTQIAPFGAFVELTPGIEGLVHVSHMGAGRRINHPEEVVHIGDRVEVSILDVDLERRRISLSMDDTIGVEETGFEPGEESGRLRVGAPLTGTVDAVKHFGVFVRLPNGDSGLLHVSQVELKGSSNPGRALYRMFPSGSQIDVIVRDIDGDRISLTLPETLAREEDQVDANAVSDSDGSDLGSLGDLLDGLEL